MQAAPGWRDGRALVNGDRKAAALRAIATRVGALPLLRRLRLPPLLRLSPPSSSAVAVAPWRVQLPPRAPVHSLPRRPPRILFLLEVSPGVHWELGGVKKEAARRSSHKPERRSR